MPNGNARIGAWLRLPLGRELLEAESEAIAPIVDDLFGLHALQIGHWGNADRLISGARARHTALIGCHTSSKAAMICRPTQIAIASDSVDAVVLPHTLELDAQPHQVLREAARILVGEGSLVVVGFNPWSFWGLRRRFSNKRFPPGVHDFISERRLSDWLALLGFEVIGLKRVFYRLPINHRGMLRRSEGLDRVGSKWWPRLCAVYVLKARKRLYTVTPLKALRSPKRNVVTGLVEPTTRVGE